MYVGKNMSRHHSKKSKQPSSPSMGKNEKKKIAHNKESSLKVKPKGSLPFLDIEISKVH